MAVKKDTKKKNTGLLFNFLNEANKGNHDFVNDLKEEEVKELSPFLLLMWFSGADRNQHLHTFLTNLYCNDKVFTLSRHPRLLLHLFVAANSGMGNPRYSFRKATNKNDSATVLMVAEYYKVGYDVAKQYLSLLTKEDLKEIEETINP